ncbi:MAG TPA: ectonucleotide pyrophosphatase/phosphodiesterase [Kofleriaceae bacterium]|nr:ectonucleotide pyrophosphatase/phosphodiesterase [Kofleriaceae bacterium]
MLAWALALPLALAGCGASSADAHGPRGAHDRPRIVIVSIDGMMPETYLQPDALGLRVPTLRALASRGAFARAVESVFPTVTYPAHTTLVTGVRPSTHHIVANRPLDPLKKNYDGWRWYSEDIAVPTLWQAAEAHGLRAALVTWPVTVGAKATFVVPEYWRAGTPDDQKLLRALSTPGLLDAVARAYPDLWTHLVPPDVHDAAQFEIATYLVTKEDPDLVLVHAWGLDDAQHDHGPRSPEAKAAIEDTDRLLGELLAALEHSPAWSRTTLVVVSDHGFAPVDREIRLNALFIERGLIKVDASGKLTSARATSIENGGTAYVYLLDPAARPEVDAALASIQPAIARVYTREEIAAAGGDPDAAFALEAAPGHAFHDNATGPAVADRPHRGHHGFPPSDPALAASFIAAGPRIGKRDLGTIRMIDIAPTVAHLLGVPLPSAEGKPLPGL